MAQVPLNHFVRASAELTTTLTQVYSAPVDTAAIMLTILATNKTSNPQTITIGVSGNGDVNANVPEKPYFDLVTAFPIPANDLVNIAIGKITLENFDTLIASSGANSAVNLTMSILETLNTTTFNE